MIYRGLWAREGPLRGTRQRVRAPRLEMIFSALARVRCSGREDINSATMVGAVGLTAGCIRN